MRLKLSGVNYRGFLIEPRWWLGKQDMYILYIEDDAKITFYYNPNTRSDGHGEQQGMMGVLLLGVKELQEMVGTLLLGWMESNLWIGSKNFCT